MLKTELDINRQEAEELESANQELEAFSYSVAHDLPIPIVWIGGYCRLLRKRLGNTVDERYSDMLGGMAERALNMEQLINALLDFSRFRYCELCGEQVNLSELALQIIDELTFESPNRKGDFHIAADITAFGDKRLLDVVLRNLLGNAGNIPIGRRRRSLSSE